MNELSIVYEVGPGYRSDLLEPKDTLSSGEKRDTVLEKTAKEVENPLEGLIEVRKQ